MSVNPSPLGGFAAQFFDNNGVILSGGKIYTYVAGTTTPQATYTSGSGVTPHANPITLDSAGRVPGGEIWLTEGAAYKFVIETSTGVLIGSYDNINDLFNSAIIVTNHVGNGVTTTFSIGATPTTKLATNVYINGVYQEKNTYSVSGSSLLFSQAPPFNSQIEIVTQQTGVLGTTSANLVSYTYPGLGAVTQTVEDRLSQVISVKDFGAVGDGVANDTAAIQAAIDYVESIDFGVGLGGGRPSIRIPAGIYLVSGLTCDKIVEFYGDGMGSTILRLAAGVTGSLFTLNAENIPGTSLDDTNHYRLDNMTLSGNRIDSITTGVSRGIDCPATGWSISTQYSASVICNNIEIFSFTGDGIYLGVNRNWALFNNVIVRYCNDNALASFGYDHLITNSSFGVCKNFGVRLYAGGSNAFTNCTIFFNKINVVINTSVNSPCFFSNCAMDAAEEHSISINGVLPPISHVFTGCRFTGSSRTAANTYSDFSIGVLAGGAQIIGCTFSLGAQTVKYLVEMNSAAEVYFTGNFFATTGSVPYGTAITNDFTALISSGYVDAWAGSYSGPSTYSVVINGVEKMRVDANLNRQLQQTRIESTIPALVLHETDAAVNEGKWSFGANANQLFLQGLNDAESVFSDAFRITRTGGTVTSVIMGVQTRISNTTPALVLVETDAPVNEGKWNLGVTAGQLSLQAFNDAETSFSDAFRISRTGATVTSIVMAAQTRISNTTPALVLVETDAAANEGKWSFGANAGQLTLQAFNDAETSFSNALQITRSGATVSAVAIGGALGLPSYAKASLPSASVAGRMIYVSDDVGGAVPAFSDGTDWRRVTDRAIIS